MKINNKIYNYILDNISVEQLEKMIKEKKKEINIMKLNIIKKDIINQKSDYELNI